VIDAPEVTALRGIGIQQMGVRVASLDKVSSDVAVLRLTLAPGAGFTYFPGQYVQVLLKDGSRRSYSMATHTPRDNQLELHIRHMPGGVFSGHVFNALQPKAILRMEGPFGSFYLRDSERPMIFLASGTGFAPIQALLEQLREQGTTGVRFTCTGAAGAVRICIGMNSCWPGRHSCRGCATPRCCPIRPRPVIGRARPAFVHRQVLSDFQSLKGFEVYACGAPIVVDSARRDYVELRQLEAADFYADAFV